MKFDQIFGTKGKYFDYFFLNEFDFKGEGCLQIFHLKHISKEINSKTKIEIA